MISPELIISLERVQEKKKERKEIVKELRKHL